MEEIKFIPLQNYVLIDVVYKDTSSGGIILPDTVKKGVGGVAELHVVKISEDVDGEGKRQVRNIKIGDQVVIEGDFGKQVMVYGKPYLLIRETDIVGILTGTDEDYKREYKTDLKIVSGTTIN